MYLSKQKQDDLAHNELYEKKLGYVYSMDRNGAIVGRIADIYINKRNKFVRYALADMDDPGKYQRTRMVIPKEPMTIMNNIMWSEQPAAQEYITKMIAVYERRRYIAIQSAKSCEKKIDILKKTAKTYK